jgi:hypothetical protein
MTVRDFDGTDDFIDLDPGDVLGESLTAWTFVAVYKSDQYHAGGLLCAMRDSDTVAAWGMNPFSDGDLYASANGFAGEPYPEDAWILGAWGKPAGSSQTPRFHLYNYDTQAAWTHTDGGAGAISDQNTTPVDRIRVGQWRNLSERFNGKLAALAVYDTNLSDAAIEALSVGLQAMLDAEPLGLWAFNQDAVTTAVDDLTENGADQTARTGTAVITDDDPPEFDFELGGEEPPPDPPPPTSHTDLWEWLRHQEREGLL